MIPQAFQEGNTLSEIMQELIRLKLWIVKAFILSSFLAKRSIIDFLQDLLEERRGLKYILSARVI